MARAMIAGSGSDSMPSMLAFGNRSPAWTANRPEPVPGSTTRCGSPWPSAQSSIERTIGSGVNVAPFFRRSAGGRREQNSSPSGSSPEAMWSLILWTNDGETGGRLLATFLRVATNRERGGHQEPVQGRRWIAQTETIEPPEPHLRHDQQTAVIAEAFHECGPVTVAPSVWLYGS